MKVEWELRDKGGGGNEIGDGEVRWVRREYSVFEKGKEKVSMIKV